MAESPTVRRRDLGARLRRYRDRKGLSSEEVAAAAGYAASWNSRLERGQSGVRPETLNMLLDLYGVTDPAERQELLALARGGRQRGWWSRYASVISREYSSYIGFEQSATEIEAYDVLVPHGLIQTEEYARLSLATNAPRDSAAARDRKVEVRLTRQQRLLGDTPLRLRVIMDESVLHRVIGGDIDVHRRQLEHLVAVAREYETVRIQVVPFAHAVLPGALSSFSVMRFEGQPEIAYIETLTGDLYEEPPESDRYTLAFDDLKAAALADSASIELIEAVLAARHGT